MKEVQWLNAYFSPTGTTYSIAKTIAEGTGCPVAEMDLSDPNCSAELSENTVLLASAPVYGGRIPAVALERISRLKGTGQKAVAVVVYGNREFDDALLELKNALTSNGFQVVAGAAFIAEHSMSRSIAAGRPDAQDEALCRRFAADVMAKADDAAPVQVPGNTPYKELKPSAFHPAANETCTKCGTCAKGCPTGAIPLDDPSHTDNERCINCMRCVEVCPMNSRALPEMFRAMITKMLNENAAGYKEPVVFL